jgi:hypothetical protein
LAFTLALFASGCSLFVVKAHPDWKTDLDQPPKCTTSYLPAILDTVLLLPPLYLAHADFGKSDASFGPADLNRPTSIGLDLLVATAFAASAVYGYSEIPVCEDAIAHQRDARQEAQRVRLFRLQKELLRDDARGSDGGDAPTAAAQAKAFGEAARAASPSPAQPAPPK